MCGIAGYNMSKKWADEKLNSEVQETLLQEAWFHNIHRGHKAAGFFGHIADVNELLVYKSCGQADHLFEADIVGKDLMEPMTVFGAHTREPSPNGGDPKFNVNNHPVQYDGVVVTHNGTVYNDTEIKNKFNLTKKQRKALGEVDSTVIAMVLSKVKEPQSNPAAVAAALSELEGSFAIHAAWQDHPGFSLLARGNSSPLIVAVHDTGQAVFYGSEIDSVKSMIKAIGMGWRVGDGWTMKKLDQGAFIMVEDGAPFEWGAFHAKTKFATDSRLDYYMARYITNAEGEREMVYLTDNKSDYIHKTKHPSVFGDEKRKGTYRREDHDDKEFPKPKGELDTIAVLAEADKVAYHDGFISAFFGNVEIILSDNRVIKDVFNHDVMDNLNRWTRLEKVTKETDINSALTFNDISWKEFFDQHKKTTMVSAMDVNSHPKEYSYVKKVPTHIGSSFSYSSAKDDKDDKDEKKGPTPQLPAHSDGVQVKWNPPFYLSWVTKGDNRKSIVENTIAHATFPNLRFFEDALCPEHKERLITHTFPYDCNQVLGEAVRVLASFENIDLWFYLQEKDEEPLVTYDLSADHTKCDDDGKGHDWIESSVVHVYSKGSQYWVITVSEECWHCSSIRSLTSLPTWFSFVKHSEELHDTLWKSYC